MKNAVNLCMAEMNLQKERERMTGNGDSEGDCLLYSTLGLQPMQVTAVLIPLS